MIVWRFVVDSIVCSMVRAQKLSRSNVGTYDYSRLGDAVRQRTKLLHNTMPHHKAGCGALDEEDR